MLNKVMNEIWKFCVANLDTVAVIQLPIHGNWITEIEKPAHKSGKPRGQTF